MSSICSFSLVRLVIGSFLLNLALLSLFPRNFSIYIDGISLSSRPVADLSPSIHSSILVFVSSLSLSRHKISLERKLLLLLI